MALKNSLLSIILILFSLNAWGQSPRHRTNLPLLSTKQAINNLRFVSHDGKFTYYQRRSGTLLLSAHYKVSEVLQGHPGTHYTIISSSDRKRLVIAQNTQFHDYLSLRQPDKLYIVDYGAEAPQYIAEGLEPRLHLNDEWLSYFLPHKREVVLSNLSSSVLNFNIKLNNIKNPYFIPEVYLLDATTVLYTDVNEAGVTGLLAFSRKENKTALLSKVDNPDQVLNLCLNHQFLYKVERGINDSTFGTRIYQYRLDTLLTKPESVLIYQSEFNDLGQLDCHAKNTSLYFIKNTAGRNIEATYEVAELNLETLKVDILSDLKYATQMINLDGRLLIPYRGEYYVILGDSDLTEEDRLSPNEDANARVN